MCFPATLHHALGAFGEQLVPSFLWCLKETLSRIQGICLSVFHLGLNNFLLNRSQAVSSTVLTHLCTVASWSLSHVLEPRSDRICMNAEKKRQHLPQSLPPSPILKGLLSPVEFGLFPTSWVWKSIVIRSQIHIGSRPREAPFRFPTTLGFSQKVNVVPKATTQTCSARSSIPPARASGCRTILGCVLPLSLNTAMYTLHHSFTGDT